MPGLDRIYGPSAPLSYECHSTSRIEEIYNHRCIAVDAECFGRLETELQVYPNDFNIQPESIQLHVHCTNFQSNRGTCAVYQ